ncbi:nitrogen regulation protein NR(II) [Achromobacter sp. NFACC18-2]|uniref:two-component system sensor histidine kinase NtrB n=1 Tax=Achromobacter sp. NFACC18-2 TaxID=1564112 RepID=UPI0008B7B25B|nr:PAS domain-containing sensor histidine kinase [Achromobacter sp. NFACC18-2]SEJ26728.1 PAS domain S-box-containing protein [Achromobacter sp. NFACC18-2]
MSAVEPTPNGASHPHSLIDVDEARRYKLLVEAVLDYAIFLLDPDGFVATWNAGAQRFKGYDASEIVGKHFSRFYTKEDRAASIPERALATAATAGRFEAEGWRVRKDGTRFWASVVIDPIRTNEGHLIGFAKITRDITEKHLGESQLHTAQQALYRAQKMEALGRVAGGLAHDFNNFLTIISGAANLLENPALTPENRQRYVRTIADTAQRASQLTKQMLAYARRQPLKPANFDTRSCVEGMKKLFESTLGSSIRLQYEISSEPCVVCADMSQLENALLNLVINARDAMPLGGNLKISVGSADSHPDGRGGAISSPLVAISVADDGEGIPAPVLEHIFEPFFTTKPVGKGTGLGLSQVFGYVNQSGGYLDVTSAPNKGTTFTLFFPKVFL